MRLDCYTSYFGEVSRNCPALPLCILSACDYSCGTGGAFGDNMEGSAMAPLRRSKFLRILLTAPLLLQAATGRTASSAGAAAIPGANPTPTAQTSVTESPWIRR